MSPRTDQPDIDEAFAKRLLEVAQKAERLMPPDQVLCGMLSAALSYAMRRNSSGDVVELLRKAADGIQLAEQPRTLN